MSNVGRSVVAIAVLLVACAPSVAIGACGAQDYSGYSGTWVGTGGYGQKVSCVIAKNDDEWLAKVAWNPSTNGIFGSGTHRFVEEDGRLIAHDDGPDSWGWLRIDGSKLVYEYPVARGSSDVKTLAEFSRQ